ncbi:hypothetical protein M388_10905 [Mesotoga sp. Brook.08.YT.4.2.5.4.]|nr:hypothetical protein M388_10905 [Mesotoga sp. Brook.08.YT.4.2.5.4.]
MRICRGVKRKLTMSRIRKISKILTGRAAVDGAGVKLV